MFGSDLEWFARFGDVPGVRYETPAGIDRRRLPGHDAKPTVLSSGSWKTLSWGRSSASPVHERAVRDEDAKQTPTPELCRNLAETLELPGVVTDYHFAIQGCAEELWRRRRREPAMIDEVERLYRLDFSLLEARPQAFVIDRLGGSSRDGDRPDYIHFVGFDCLRSWYEREGFLREALEVAELAEQFGQAWNVGELREAVASAEREDAPASDGVAAGGRRDDSEGRG